jgi:nicotinate-nucleotide adenylyltransferase
VFGGAFDPPHQGHAVLAQTAIAQLQLDELRVFPTGDAWHKTRPLSAAAHRVAMARLAFATQPRVVVDARETLRTGPTYTVDTLEELAREYPGAELFLIIGEDQARALPTWHRWESILDFAIICVAARADSTGADGPFESLSTQIPGLIRLKMPPMPVSATEIRHKIALGQAIAPLVFDSVARYIEQHHLYQSA